MPPLEKQRSISDNFNKKADVELRKKIDRYQLTKEENQKIIDLLNELNDRTNREIAAFKNKEEFNKRLHAKVKELGKKHGKLTPEYTLKGPRQSRSQGAILPEADTAIRRDHRVQLDRYYKDCRDGIDSVLNQVSKDGRGPNRSEQNPPIAVERILNDTQARHMDERARLLDKHHKKIEAKKEELAKFYQVHDVEREIKRLDETLKEKPSLFRRLSGKSARDVRDKENLDLQLRDINQRTDEQLQPLERQRDQALDEQEERHEEEWKKAVEIAEAKWEKLGREFERGTDLSADKETPAKTREFSDGGMER